MAGKDDARQNQLSAPRINENIKTEAPTEDRSILPCFSNRGK
jgi:hypothetical protein